MLITPEALSLLAFHKGTLQKNHPSALHPTSFSRLSGRGMQSKWLTKARAGWGIVLISTGYNFQQLFIFYSYIDYIYIVILVLSLSPSPPSPCNKYICYSSVKRLGRHSLAFY
uniref:Uncharacterized protein n=1 Tax=Anguilla anguilla TaxID=7936 RepID=A0A0E9X0B8_ANGAN